MIAGSQSGSCLGEVTSQDDSNPTIESHGTEDMQTRLRLTRTELAALSPLVRQILSEICLEIVKARDSAEI